MYLLHFQATGDCADEAIIFTKDVDEPTLDFAYAEARKKLDGDGVTLANKVVLDPDVSFRLRDIRMDHAYVG